MESGLLVSASPPAERPLTARWGDPGPIVGGCWSPFLVTNRGRV